MIVSINNPIQATWIFSFILLAALLASLRSRRIAEWLPASLTTELKGMAILMIVISHIGYFLVSDHRFLWPLSIMAGVGVNLFLFLSGFGLASSGLQKDLSVWQFYKRRLLKLFVPFWLSIAVFLAADFFILGKAYSFQFIGRAILGIFKHADLYNDLNSPLWYFTFILLCYLLFPLVFSKKRLWLTAIIFFIAGDLIVRMNPDYFIGVMHLYKVHIFAFPLGILAAGIVLKLPSASILERSSKGWRAIGYYLTILIFLAVFAYANFNSGIGESAAKEQWMSLLAVVSIVLVFILKKREYRLFSIFGLYSYEIYLWHWPILYRYDLLYGIMPAWLATVLYLIAFLGIGWAAQKASAFIFSLKNPAGSLVKKKD